MCSPGVGGGAPNAQVAFGKGGGVHMHPLCPKAAAYDSYTGCVQVCTSRVGGGVSCEGLG